MALNLLVVGLWSGQQSNKSTSNIFNQVSLKNTYVEQFNGTVRYEWLSKYCWQSIDEIQMFATQWIYKYNHQRPNMALGGFTPKQRLAMVA